MPTLLLTHIINGGAPPKPWTPTVHRVGTRFSGLSLDGVNPVLSLPDVPVNALTVRTRVITIANLAGVSLEVDEPEPGLVRMRLWSLP